MNIISVPVAKQVTYRKTSYATIKNVKDALDKLIDEGGSCSKLGTPSDGVFSDGVLNLTPSTTVTDAIDKINEVIKDITPAEPGALHETDLVCNITVKSGTLVSGLSSAFYTKASPGDTINNVIANVSSFTLSPEDPSTRFSRGDEGLLEVHHSVLTSGLSAVSIIDIDANFVLNEPGTYPTNPTSQDLSLWNITGDGSVVEEGVSQIVASGSGDTIGTLEILSVGVYNSFNNWQKMNARLNMNSSVPIGYNVFKLSHRFGDDSVDETNELEMYISNEINAPSINSSILFQLASGISSSSYISGVRYYGIGDEFSVNFIADNLYNNIIYDPENVAYYTFTGLTDTVYKPTSGGTINPTDSFQVEDVITVDKENEYNIDAKLNIYLMNLIGSVVTYQVPASLKFLLNTYSSTGISTGVREYFVDENYRLPAGSYDTVPVSLTGNWSSSSLLTNGKALVFNSRVQYPNLNLSTDYRPENNPNYSTGFSGNQYYLRGFYTADPKSNVELTLSGLSVTNISEVGAGSVNVEIKLPRQTGWLDAAKYFSAAGFSGVNGDGIMVSKTGNVLSLTFGTFSTYGSDGVMIVRITFRNTSYYVSGLQVNW